MATFNVNSDIEMEEEYQEGSSLEYLISISDADIVSIENIEVTSTVASTVASTSASTSASTKKQRSWVWEHYTMDDSTSKPRCNYCKTCITATQGNTSGMSRHLKNKHPLRIESNEKQLTLHKTLQNTVTEVNNKLFVCNISYNFNI